MVSEDKISKLIEERDNTMNKLNKLEKLQENMIDSCVEEREGKQKILKVKEMYPECCDEIMKTMDEAFDLFCIKQHDYGDANIRLGLNLRSSQTSESLANSRFAQMGIAIRMNDKISRLLNLYKNGIEDTPAVNETVKDTVMDIVNYACILQTVRKDKWGK